MPLKFYDKIIVIALPDRTEKIKRISSQIHHFYPDEEFIVLDAVDTRHIPGEEGGHHVGCALSHRKAIKLAKISGYESILVLEEDAILHKNFKNLIHQYSKSLDLNSWDVIYLGAHTWNRKYELSEFSPYFFEVFGATCTHGIAYHFEAYDLILDSIPDNEVGCRDYIEKHKAIDQWLMCYMQGGGSEGIKSKLNRTFKVYLTNPSIVSQPPLCGDGKLNKPLDFYQGASDYNRPLNRINSEDRVENLVFASVGDQNSLSHWIGNNDHYHIFLVYYGNEDNQEKWLKKSSDYFEKRQGSKFQNFYHYFLEKRELFDSYDRFFLLDDDIFISSDDIVRMFEFSKQGDWSMCGPTFSEESKHSYELMISRKNGYRVTNFIETNVPLFNKKTLQKLMDAYDPKLISWGIDYLCSQIIDHDKIALNDEIQCVNPHDHVKGGTREISKIKDSGIRAQIWNEYADSKNYLKVIHPVTYQAFDSL